MDMTTKEGRAAVMGATLEWLQAGAPHTSIGDFDEVGFNMRWVISGGTPDWSGQDCGTSCCILGHVQLLGGERYKGLSKARRQEAPNRVEESPLFRMFYPNEEMLNSAKELERDEDEWDDLTKITPRWAALTLTHYIETGETDWLRFKAEGLA